MLMVRWEESSPENCTIPSYSNFGVSQADCLQITSISIRDLTYALFPEFGYDHRVETLVREYRNLNIRGNWVGHSLVSDIELELHPINIFDPPKLLICFFIESQSAVEYPHRRLDLALELRSRYSEHIEHCFFQCFSN